MFQVYAAAWDSENCSDRSQIFDSLTQAQEYFSYLKDNPSLMEDCGFDLTLTEVSSNLTLCESISLPR